MDFLPYFIERPRSARASCTVCHQSFEMDKIRIAKVAMGPFNTRKPMFSWYHIDCFLNALMRQRPATARPKSTDDIENFANILPEEKKEFLKKLNEMEAQYCKKHNLEFKEIEEPPCQDNGTSSTSNLEFSGFNELHDDCKFKTFQKLCEDIRAHNGHLDKKNLIKNFFRKGSDNTGFKGNISRWCRFLMPGTIKRVYNLQDRQLIKIFSKLLNCNSISDTNAGNIGQTLQSAFEIWGRGADDSTLTMSDVDTFLGVLEKLTKEQEQIDHFKLILDRCTSVDLKYIIYLIKGDLRINAGSKFILDGIHEDADDFFRKTKNINKVMNKLTKYENSTLVFKSPGGDVAGIALMTPIEPMLAEPCKSIEEAFKKIDDGMLAEIKYDGERVQIHKKDDTFSYYSRSLKPVLDHKISSFKTLFAKAFPYADELILDSEILVLDKDGKILPFGSLGVNKKKEYGDTSECLFIFDCLYHNGDSLIDLPLKQRRQFLEENLVPIENRIMLSKSVEISEKSHLEALINEVLSQNLEGIMLKDLRSKYQPAKRKWLKIKKDYIAGGAMADSADLVVLGAFTGTGKKGGMCSTFLMGCYDKHSDKWLTVTKVSGGLNDERLADLQTHVRNTMSKVTKDNLPDWLVCNKQAVPDFVADNPKVQPVWEIRGNEFTKAEIHTADGISIRFPRFIIERTDKDWNSATNLDELKQLFENSRWDPAKFNKYGSSSSAIFEHGSLLSPTKKKEEPPKSPIPKLTLKRKVKEYYTVDTNKPGPSKRPAPSKTSDQNGHKPSVPLPDVFNGCVVKFYRDVYAYDAVMIKKFKAYGGVCDKSTDFSQADYIIHLGQTFKYSSIDESCNFPPTARHVNVLWLSHSLNQLKVLDTRPFAVSLTK